MRHPMNIRAESPDEDHLVPTTAQFVWQAHDMDKPEIVARILQADDVGRVLVFTRTKRTAQRVADELVDRGFPASPLHGDMAQTAREKALQRFRDGKVNTLVATDVAARGIDVAGITHVINYNCPEDHKTYLHRIGRTGRAGASGIAVTFVDWADMTRWQLINKELDLPFPQPQETYSTSEHLFHDLGIAHDAKGRLKPPAPKEPRRDSDRGRGRGGQGPKGQGGRPQQATPSQESGAKTSEGGSSRNRNRRRNRTRGGQTVSKAD
jgi:superfamily II DNA/RNA helicase